MTIGRQRLVCVIILVLSWKACRPTEVCSAGVSSDAENDPSARVNAQRTQSPQENVPQNKTSSSADAVELDYPTLLPKGQYVGIFENQMNLILSEYWSEDGNWKADMMNHATAFAPRLLFKMYAKTKREDLYRRAITTCNYQTRMLGKVVRGEETMDLHSVCGVYGLLSSMKHAKTEQERASSTQLMKFTLTIGCNTLLFDIGQPLFPDLQEYECISLPFVAIACLEFCEIERWTAMLETARQLIQKHEEQYYDKQTGLFWGKKFGEWNSAFGLLALAKAYSVTKEEQYLHKAQEVINNLREHSMVFGGVFYGEPSLEAKNDWSLSFFTLLIHINLGFPIWTIKKHKFLRTASMILPKLS